MHVKAYMQAYNTAEKGFSNIVNLTRLAISIL
jgi:hypothetical protein